ncbi:MAG TPA: hypothetical protein VJ957_03645 [Longimicrobiales bacterium]|nr:hypothetical protein [Longimicrobiales bacterium]
MRLNRGLVPILFLSVAALGACSDATSAADPCADFQGTWNTQSFTYRASANPITARDLTSVAAIALTLDDNCNYTGSADIQDVTSGAISINGMFTLDARFQTLDLLDATAFGNAFNATYQYTFSGNTLTLVNPSTEYDFDGAGPNPAFPATLTITFERQAS